MIFPKPTKLSTFLNFYLKARSECYVENMRGAKCLFAWLTSPIYPDIIFTTSPYLNVPDELVTYETLELAKILSRYEQKNDLDLLNSYINAIVSYHIDKVRKSNG